MDSAECLFSGFNIQIEFARLQIFTAIKIQVSLFWIVTRCSDVVGYERFGGPFRLHLHPLGSDLNQRSVLVGFICAM